ncbi:MAG TPA: NADH-quinone oxidoreductase subunit NuoG [Casimicrobiaceae bacterium]|nr:NADH-quinone oxidoreductase subunit NuoG [Casimicrobiaceae bacterium]
MLNLEIDGKKVEVENGATVMDAANKLGIYVPHFCYHKKLSIAANCRMCLVQVEKAPKPLPACATPATDGMKVWTHSDLAVEAQKGVMEFLLINHPLDCPICDQGGECQLQDLAVGYGASNSRYTEPKRVVFHKYFGPLVAGEEMTRCIHCTRCVRFGQEIAGVMELGMRGRGEHAEIVSFLGEAVSSELSGNMIDLCPVGALTSKPFRYKARTWELARRKSIAPHDALGSNVIVQVIKDKVMRVLPLENEQINECWLSDKDRFSYEGLNSDERLDTPVIRENGVWKAVDWQVALEFTVRGLRAALEKSGGDGLGTIVSPHSTVEEMALAARFTRALGSDNIDFRLRQTDFGAARATRGIPWLGMSIADVGALKSALVIGSFLRKEQPLLAQRLRQAARKGAKVSMLHVVDDEWLMPMAHKMVTTPSQLVAGLAEIVVAAGRAAGKDLPAALRDIQPRDSANDIAKTLSSGERRGILLGSYAEQHPEASQLLALAQLLAEFTGATVGCMPEAANSVGGYVVEALPSSGGRNAQRLWTDPRNAYVVLHAEPELDVADPVAAHAALDKAQFVVMLSPFEIGTEYADVILPIGPFTETSGTFINCEGRAQSFQGVVRPRGDTRPGWKVLRVLGSMLGLPGFDFETIDDLRKQLPISREAVAARLDNASTVEIAAPRVASRQMNGALERVADVPIHFADPLVRRAPSLQKTSDAKPPTARMHPGTLERLGLTAEIAVRVRQGDREAVLTTDADPSVPEGVVRISAAHPTTWPLGLSSEAVTVERAP